MPANAIVLQPQAGNAFALTGVSSAYNQPSAFQPIGQTVYTTASIPANANNALYGKALTISGFVAPYTANNGTFAVLSSTATTITVNNAFGVVHTAAATAAFETQGFPASYASKVENMWSNQTGDNVTVNAVAGDCLVAVVIGLKQIVDFDQLHGTAPYYPQFGNNAGTAADYPSGGFNLGQLAGLNDFNANPTVSDFASGLPVDVLTSKLSAGTLTITYENPTSPSPYFATTNIVTLTGTKEPWLNGANITVATSTVTTEGTPTSPVYVSQITATAGFTVPVFSLTSSEGADVVPGQPTTTTYLGTVAGGADDAFAGYSVTIAAFGNAANNGPFTVVNSTATSLTVLNSAGVAQAGPQHVASVSKTEGASTYTATAATYGTAGNSLTLAVDDTVLSAPTLVGNAITIHTLGVTVAAYVAAYPSVTTTSGTYIGVVNFSFSGAGTDLFTTAAAAPFTGGLNPATGTVTAYSQGQDTGEAQVEGNTWSLATSSNIIDSDYTVAYPFSGPLNNGVYIPSMASLGPRNAPPGPASNLPTTLTPSNPYQSSKWNIDGYYPSIYIYVAPNVKGGSYKVNLNSMYQPGINVPQDWAQGGEPIFDGGVNFQVYCLSGVAAATPVEAFSIATTASAASATSNPATAPATLVVANADGDALISVAVAKSANALSVGSTGISVATSLVLTAVTPFTTPGTSGSYPTQNYGGALYTGTITGGAANGLVGNVFTVAGFSAVAGGNNNGTFTCIASTATTLTLTNGAAVAATHAATASYTPLMTRISNGKLVGSEAHYVVEYFATGAGGSSLTGTFNPGFQNPLGYPVLVASVAIKSS